VLVLCTQVNMMFVVLRPFSTSPVSYRNVSVSMRRLKRGLYIHVLPSYFRVYSRIKIKSSSQVNFLAYYGSTNQSTFTKFWNLKTFSLRYGTVRAKWKTECASTPGKLKSLPNPNNTTNIINKLLESLLENFIDSLVIHAHVKRVSQHSTESRGFSLGAPVSSHKESWQGRLGYKHSQA
jgi:hypothetical protein